MKIINQVSLITQKVMGFRMKITFKVLCLAIVLNLMFVNIGFTQAPPAEEEEFNDLG